MAGLSEFVSGLGDQRIVAHDPSWVEQAGNLSARLQEVLGSTAVRIEHIGSTSVPGLAARPIPDIQVSVRDVGDRGSFVPALESIGYTHFRFPELDIDDYLVFVPADGSNTEHIQICQAGSHQELRHLAVRDFLRSHPEESVGYARVKRKAAIAANGERAVYSKGKDAFVHALEERALKWHAAQAQVRSVVSSDGTRIHFEVRGDGDPVVLLHGLACRRQMWNGVADRLVGAGRRVVIPDLRGHGDSREVLGGYCLDQLTDDTKAVLSEIGSASAVLVGHSAGGIQAILAAADDARVSGVVTIGTSLTLDSLRERLVLAFSATRLFYVLLSVPIIGRLIVRTGAFGRSPEPAHVTQSVADALACPPSTKRAWVKAMIKQSFVGVVAGLGVPVALGGGERDKAFSTKRVRASVSSAKEIQTFVVPGAGHMAPMEQPDVVARHILELAEA